AQFVVFTHFNIPDTAGKWTINFYGTKGRILGDKIIGQIDEGSLWELALVEGRDDMFMEPVEGNRIGKEIVSTVDNIYRMYTINLTKFSNAILNGSEDYIDPMECVKDQRVIDAAYESSSTGRTIYL
ncbi:MAG: Gfo/Idh/MocA family oxidoreductase, partial [Lachnospiraceae bacterium]|nr:Gfo/Idh/MocA family oxidoreductase [Lachnospiraceae bacterium]